MKNTYIQKFIWLVMIALFFVLPFERIPTIEIAGFTVKISYILGLLLIILVGINKPIELIKKYKLSKPDYFLIVFLIISLLSIPNSPDKTRSIIIITLWSFMVSLYLILSRLLADHPKREKVENFIIISSVLVSLFGIYQFIGDSFSMPTNLTGLRDLYTKNVLGFPRIQSVALEPLYFASFLMVPIFLSIGRYINQDKMLNKYFAVIILLVINMILTVSRGAYIAIALSIIILIAFLIRQGMKNKKYFHKAFGLLGIFIISFAISFIMIEVLNKGSWNKFSSHASKSVEVVNTEQLEKNDGSAADRFDTFRQAIDLYKKHPVIGSAPGSFGVLYSAPANIEKGDYRIVNNQYLELLAETGVLGLIAFLGFLIMLLIETIKFGASCSDKDRIMLLSITLGCVAIFIQYNFFSTLYIIYIWLFLALLKSHSYVKKAS